MYRILETLSILNQNNHCFNAEEEQAYKEVREWICDKLEEEHQRILDMSKPCVKNIGEEVQAVYNDSLKAYEKEKEEFLNILNLDGVNREIFKEVLDEIIEASPELFEDSPAYRKPISSLDNAISEDAISAKSKLEEYAMNKEVDNLVNTKDKHLKVLQEAGNKLRGTIHMASLKYEICLNCKHHFLHKTQIQLLPTNQGDIQNLECTLKLVSDLYVNGYCYEFMPR